MFCSAIRERERREVAPGKENLGRKRRKKKVDGGGRRKGPSINDGCACWKGGGCRKADNSNYKMLERNSESHNDVRS